MLHISDPETIKYVLMKHGIYIYIHIHPFKNGIINGSGT